jgi:hypothetical protein
MPGYILHVGALVMCAHGGMAQPTSPFPRVLVGGQPVVTQSAPYMVAGCPQVSIPGAPVDVTATWVTGAVRVTAGGMPVLLQDSQSICSASGTPLTIAMTQVRVKGT